MADIGEVVRDTITQSKNGFPIEYALDKTSGLNRVIRNAEPLAAQLGRRYECAERFVIMLDGVETGVSLSGKVKTDSGAEVYMGCGSSVLCTKASGGAITKDVPPDVVAGAPYCCEKPMLLMNPKPLPSSD
ncbi:hypothetical protein HYU40_04905 [Candidatus Woesearchaeota archaeon]|nr:hypothetical protein [Candidatus Woesearchaeota archaeon]